ncbi:MAG: LysR family transcriptional regulator [Negativicutes bacterium]|nr:LysR family transcriptional regulator [Negativicutes bacterium]
MSPISSPGTTPFDPIAPYRAVKELGLAGTEVGNHLNLTQSAVSRAVRRGEEMVKELGLSLIGEGNAYFHGRPLSPYLPQSFTAQSNQKPSQQMVLGAAEENGKFLSQQH